MRFLAQLHQLLKNKQLVCNALSINGEPMYLTRCRGQHCTRERCTCGGSVEMLPMTH